MDFWFATFSILIFVGVPGQPCIFGFLGQGVKSCSPDPTDSRGEVWFSSGRELQSYTEAEAG